MYVFAANVVGPNFVFAFFTEKGCVHSSKKQHDWNFNGHNFNQYGGAALATVRLFCELSYLWLWAVHECIVFSYAPTPATSVCINAMQDRACKMPAHL